MIKKLFLLPSFLLVCIAFQAQMISGKVFNSSSLKPINNVAIITDLKTGTASNSSGIYQLNLKNIKTVTFSCLGYQSLTIKINELKNQKFVVSLIEKINQLDEIQLNLAIIDLDSLMLKSVKSMKNNYISNASKQDFYSNEKQEMDFKNLELDLKSSTLMSRKNRKLAKQELAAFSNKLMNQKPRFSKEFKGTLSSKKVYSEKTKKTFVQSKIDNVDGFIKNDIGNGITIDNVQEKLQNIVLKYLKDDKTYKIKTGIFKIEDSLSFNEVKKLNDSIQKDNSFNKNQFTYLKFDADYKSLFFKRKKQYNFFNKKYYEHKLEKNDYIGNELFYVISFQPRKSKSKFSGKIYINPKDFTFKKISYKYAKGKRGEHINLKLILGIKFSENESSTVLFYEKNEEGKIYTSYHKNSFTNYAYVNRPIKFIENSKEKGKMKFNIKVEVVVSESSEYLASNLISIPKEKIKKYNKEDLKKRKKYLTKIEYDLTSWKNKKIILEYLEKYQ